MKNIIWLLFIGFSFVGFSQETSTFKTEEIEINKHIDGTLISPNTSKPNLAILIAGSGPTDRNGNQNFLMNDALKKLANNITNKGIATFRYDKRIVKQIRKGKVDRNISFDDFVTDAISVIDYFKKTKHYNKIYVIGHSQGSLVGLLAAKDKADGFISLAGAGQSIDAVISEQVEKTAPMFSEDTKRILSILKKGKTTRDFPVALSSLFNIEVQPFMSNWMKYNPQEEIKKLKMPILIINGTKDLQVSKAEAKLLKDSAPSASLVIIDKMNHILVPIEGDDLENSKSYNEAYRKLSLELIDTITDFIK